MKKVNSRLKSSSIHFFVIVIALLIFISCPSFAGPLIDRIDIHIDVPAVTFQKLRSKSNGTDSATIRADVIKAREIQTRRFGSGRITTNAMMTHKKVEKHCPLDAPGEQMLKEAMTTFGLSARAHDKICKIARTIADLDGKNDIAAEHIAEAVSYRKLDRQL